MGFNARGRPTPASSSSVSCFGPMLSGSLLADLFRTTLPYCPPILCVGVLSYSHPSSQRPVSLISSHETYDIMCPKSWNFLLITVCSRLQLRCLSIFWYTIIGRSFSRSFSESLKSFSITFSLECHFGTSSLSQSKVSWPFVLQLGYHRGCASGF